MQMSYLVNDWKYLKKSSHQKLVYCENKHLDPSLFRCNKILLGYMLTGVETFMLQMVMLQGLYQGKCVYIEGR